MGSYANSSDKSIFGLTGLICLVVIGLVIGLIIVMTRHKDNKDNKDKYSALSDDTNSCRCSSRFPGDGNSQPICNQACDILGKCQKDCGEDVSCRKTCLRQFQSIMKSLCDAYPIEKRASCDFTE